MKCKQCSSMFRWKCAWSEMVQRDRSVSEDVMRKMAEKLKPPVFEEGFSKITVVRVKSAS